MFRALIELGVADTGLWEAFDEPSLKKVLREPAKEAELRKPVKNFLKEEKRVDRVAAEVPLPSRKARRGSIADIIGFKKKLLGGREGHAVELKTELSKGAFRQAFAQAKEDRRYCEYAAVCFSPYVYLHFLDEIDHELQTDDYEGIGVWVASTEGVLIELRTPTLGDVEDVNRDSMFDWIGKHEY